VQIGDELSRINGETPRDVIAYQMLVDEAEVALDVSRGGLSLEIDIVKGAGEPLGIEVSAALFDQVRTCDNHCEFCFIYQLPKGMRPSLYMKDDDYRLSFLFGNFTTLTRFTEADLERVVTERLSPLYVSIHATNPLVRADMLRNRRGATSLRWLRQLLDFGIEVHGQVVVCPGLNDGAILVETLLGILDEYPELVTVAVVPLGISDHSNESRMRAHTRAEAAAVVDTVHDFQELFQSVLGRPLVFAADEYYLLADRPFPEARTYEGFPMHEDGIGMAATFAAEFRGETSTSVGPQAGFFASVDGAPAEGYRAPRLGGIDPNPAPSLAPVRAASAPAGKVSPTRVALGARRPRADAPIAILTAGYGARVLGPLLDEVSPALQAPVRLIEVKNDFFGGNISVTGLMVGADVASALEAEPAGHRYLLPDVCLSNGIFLDGMAVDDLPLPIEVVATDGIALREALGLSATPGSVGVTEQAALAEARVTQASADEVPADRVPVDRVPVDEVPAAEVAPDEVAPDEVAPNGVAQDGNTGNDEDSSV